MNTQIMLAQVQTAIGSVLTPNQLDEAADKAEALADGYEKEYERHFIRRTAQRLREYAADKREGR